MALTVNSKPSGFRPIGGGELIYQFTEASVSGKPNYRVEISCNGITGTFQYRPDASLVIRADIAPILRSALDMSFTAADRYVSTYVTYQAVWDGGSDSAVNLTGDVIFAYVGVDHYLNRRTKFEISSSGGQFLIPTDKLYAWADRTGYIEFLNGSDLGTGCKLYYSIPLTSTDDILTFDGSVKSLQSASNNFTDDGIICVFNPNNAWTDHADANNIQWKGVTYGDGLYVAVGIGDPANVMTSPDGITWTSESGSSTNDWRSVTYGNGFFVAVASSGTGNRVMTSPDGAAWTSRVSAADNSWQRVIYANGLFVAVSGDGTNRVMTSANGVDWTSRTTPGSAQWRGIAYGNNTFVVVGHSAGGINRVMTSPNGIDWTLREAASAIGWYDVAFGNGIFVAVSSDSTGSQVMTSSDGITWTLRATPHDSIWVNVAFGNGMFMAISQDASNSRTMWSLDGVTWTVKTIPVVSDWWDIAYGDGDFVAVSDYSGVNSTIVISGVTESIDVKVLPECLNPVYLKWINDLGGISSWLFSYNQIYNLTPQILWRDKVLTCEANVISFDVWKMLQELNKDGVEYGDNQKVGQLVVDFTDEAYPVNVITLPESSETWTKKAKHNFSLAFRYAQIPNILL